jgi:DNA-binding winged helix-turn-helix (wHTH) protein/tetratricopeptide (TPR) repeat protein
VLYCFLDFALDGRTLELRRADRPVPLQPKVFDVLHYLLAHSERVVSRRELLDAVWPGEVVSPSSLTHAIMDSRRAVDDDGHEQRLIRTVRGRGYRFVGELRAVDELPRAAAELREGRPGLVGRAREIERIDQAIDDACSARPRTLLLAGPPGIGKTTLTQTLLEHARERGARALIAHCHEAEQTPPYWPWIQLIRDYLSQTDPEQVKQHMGVGAADISRLLPELRDHIHVEAPSAIDPEQDRFRLFASLTTFARNLHRERPLVLVIDDAHWADLPSLILLRFAAREMEDGRLLIAAAYRDDELLGDEERSTVLADVRTARSAELITLHGLSRDEVGDLGASELGEALPEPLVSALQEQTEGNPFFVKEVLRHWNEEGSLRPDGPRRGMPATVHDVIGRRLARLSPSCVEVLEFAAVIGTRFEPWLLERVLEQPGPRIQAALDEAMVARDVGETLDSPGSWEFAHALIREVLYERVPVNRRRQMHGAVGRALADAHDEPEWLAEIAHHFVEAAPLGEHARALDATIRAGEHAFAQVGYEEACALFRAGLRVLELPGARDDQRRCDLLLALGASLSHGGQPGAAKDVLREAADLGEQLGAPEQVGVAALAVARPFFPFTVGEVDESHVELLEQALRLLPREDTAMRTRVLSRLAIARYWADDVQLDLALGEESVRMARRLPDPGALAFALYARYVTRLRPSFDEKRLADAHELLEVVRGAGEVDLEIAASMLVAEEYVSVNRFDEADLLFESLASRARTQRHPQAVQLYPSYRATVALREGRLDEAERLALDAYRMAIRVGDDNAQVTLAPRLATIYGLRGRAPEGDAPRPGPLPSDHVSLPWRAGVAVHMARSGQEERARSMYKRLLAESIPERTDSYLWTIGTAYLAELTVRMGDREQAVALYKHLLPKAGRNVIVGLATQYEGPISYYLARLASCTGDPSAIAHFEQALEEAEAARAAPFRARIQVEMARHLRDLSAPPDPGRATALAGQAAATASDLGLAPILRDAQSLLS